MIASLLNAEGKTHEKAAAIATGSLNDDGTTVGGALKSTNTDKVSVIAVVDSTKDSKVAAVAETTTAATTTTTTTTRRLSTRSL